MNMKDEKCPCCGRRPKFEIAAIWYTLEEKEPPKDREIILKHKKIWLEENTTHSVVVYDESFRTWICEDRHYIEKNIEKWMEIPQ
jgi:hypothetical protein